MTTQSIGQTAGGNAPLIFIPIEFNNSQVVIKYGDLNFTELFQIRISMLGLLTVYYDSIINSGYVVTFSE